MRIHSSFAFSLQQITARAGTFHFQNSMSGVLFPKAAAPIQILSCPLLLLCPSYKSDVRIIELQHHLSFGPYIELDQESNFSRTDYLDKMALVYSWYTSYEQRKKSCCVGSGIFTCWQNAPCEWRSCVSQALFTLRVINIDSFMLTTWLHSEYLLSYRNTSVILNRLINPTD